MAEISARFDASAHSIDAVQRAAYRFSDRLSAEIRLEGDTIECLLAVLGDSSEVDDLVADFRTEVLDQVLRERIRAETEGARNLILALAFSNTTLTATD